LVFNFVADRKATIAIITDVERATAVHSISLGFANVKELFLGNRSLPGSGEVIDLILDGDHIIETVGRGAFEVLAGPTDVHTYRDAPRL
jgi:hypothetical protein